MSYYPGKSRATARAVVDERTFELHVTLTGSPILDHIPGTSESRSDVNILNSVEYPSCLSESQSEPDYVTNLKKYFNDGYYTGTYYRKLSSKGGKSPYFVLVVIIYIAVSLHPMQD